MKTLLLALPLLLGACGLSANIQAAQQQNPGDPIGTLKQVAVTDLMQASAMAAKATDPEADVRKACWDALALWIPTIQAPFGIGVSTNGAASTIELGFETGNQLQTLSLSKLIPKTVHVACAPVLIDGQTFINMLAIKLGGSVIPAVNLLPIKP